MEVSTSASKVDNAKTVETEILKKKRGASKLYDVELVKHQATEEKTNVAEDSKNQKVYQDEGNNKIDPNYVKYKAPTKAEKDKSREEATATTLQAAALPFANMSFAVTGVFSDDVDGREGVEFLIKSYGGKLQSAVSGKTNYLIWYGFTIG